MSVLNLIRIVGRIYSRRFTFAAIVIPAYKWTDIDTFIIRIHVVQSSIGGSSSISSEQLSLSLVYSSVRLHCSRRLNASFGIYCFDDEAEWIDEQIR